ncbi:MAG TPA: phytanoyl-CoA dioxygenase family protein [Acidimicrobiales bacterium]
MRNPATTVRYRRDGFVVIPAVLDEATVAECFKHLGRLQGEGRLTGPIVTAPLERDEFLSGLVGDYRLSGLAGCLLRSQPLPFGCTYFVKEPGGHPVGWHQDGHPWRTQLGITEAVTVWIALDAADVHNGGLRVIPGSHTLAAQPLRPTPEGNGVFGAEIDPALVDDTLARQLRLAPGDVAAHHPNLIHGSLANRSARPRRALAVRYRAV